MKVLITGATSGIGLEMGKIYLERGYTVVGTGRNEIRLEMIRELGFIPEKADSSDENDMKALFEKHKDADILINNAGFGDLGFFSETSLEKDISMIKTNILGLHILTKLFFGEMVRKNRGKILNVASIAGFMPGPLMATYYATKSYVVRLSEALSEEAKKLKKNVYVGILCPGPVKTRFDEVAGVSFSLKSADPEKIAKYTISCVDKNKKVIVPTMSVKLAKFFAKLVPERFTAKICFKMQSEKIS